MNSTSPLAEGFGKIRSSLRNKPECWGFGILVGTGVLLRLVFLLTYRNSLLFNIPIGPDVQEYFERATDILNGNFFPAGNDYHAPLYSWALAGMLYLCHGSIPAVRVVQLVLNFGGWLGFFFALRRMPSVSNRVSWAFLALAMLYPVPLFHESQLISESLLVPILAGCFWLFTSGDRSAKRWKKLLLYAGAGICAGLAAVTHPLTLAFGAVLAAWVLLIRRAPVEAIVIAAGIALCVLPVSIINSARANRPVLIQSGGTFNFWLGNNPNATGGCYLRPGYDWDQAHRVAAADANRQAVSVDRIWLRQVGDFVEKAPLAAIALDLRKAVMVWSPRELISGADPDRLVRETGVIFCGMFLTLPIFALCWFGLFRILREHDKAGVWFALLLFSMWAAQILTVTSGRYRTAMIPAVLFLAAVGITALDWRRWFPVPLILAALSIPLLLPIRNNGEAASLLGEAAYRKGQLVYARKMLEFAAQAMNAPGRFFNLLGSIAMQEGRFPEAEVYFRKAVKAEPDKPEGRMNLANLAALDPGRRKEADAAYRKAIEAFPNHADLYFNYGIFLERHGQLKEAQHAFAEAVKLVPNHIPALNGLGTTAFQLKDFREALRCFEKVNRLAPENRQYLNNLYCARRAIGQNTDTGRKSQ